MAIRSKDPTDVTPGSLWKHLTQYSANPDDSGNQDFRVRIFNETYDEVIFGENPRDSRYTWSRNRFLTEFVLLRNPEFDKVNTQLKTLLSVLRLSEDTDDIKDLLIQLEI